MRTVLLRVVRCNGPDMEFRNLCHVSVPHLVHRDDIYMIARAAGLEPRKGEGYDYLREPESCDIPHVEGRVDRGAHGCVTAVHGRIV